MHTVHNMNMQVRTYKFSKSPEEYTKYARFAAF